MERLITYLRQERSIIDISALLTSQPKNYETREYGAWVEFPAEAWRGIMLNMDDNKIICYYKPDDNGFIVSDCGMSITEIMRRTGWNSRNIHNAMYKIVHSIDLDGQVDLDSDLRSHGGNRYERSLETAIINVMFAIAKCQGVKL